MIHRRAILVANPFLSIDTCITIPSDSVVFLQHFATATNKIPQHRKQRNDEIPYD